LEKTKGGLLWGERALGQTAFDLIFERGTGIRPKAGVRAQGIDQCFGGEPNQKPLGLREVIEEKKGNLIFKISEGRWDCKCSRNSLPGGGRRKVGRNIRSCEKNYGKT